MLKIGYCIWCKKLIYTNILYCYDSITVEFDKKGKIKAPYTDLHYDCSKIDKNYFMGKAITPKNYIGHYTTWCLRNNITPISYEVLKEIFTGCESLDDYKNTLNVLYDFQIEGFQLSFMQQDKLDAKLVRLKLRLELFKRVPTATNMLLAYNLIEDITLEVFKAGNLEFEDKKIEKFDKLKNLALGTKFINERKVAFDRSVETFKNLTKVEI